MPAALQPVLSGADRQVALISPYLVPGREGMATLTALAARGVHVSVLTNALSATNHILVHGAYRRYRRGMLAAGMAVHEFAPPPVRPAPRARGEMLHTKAFVVDGKLGFVGSFNFDLRSLFPEHGDGGDRGPSRSDRGPDGGIRPCHRARRGMGAIARPNRALHWRRDAVTARRDPDAPAWRRGLSWVDRPSADPPLALTFCQSRR
jgi:cardiolipin synthase C